MADPKFPNWTSPAYDAMKPGWTRCRDVRAGTERLRENKGEYLPKFEAEDSRDWDHRVKMTVVMDFFEQAVTTLVGLGLRHDPELGEKVPEELVQDWENLDGEGSHGAVVAQQALDCALTDGHLVLFTDYPPVSTTLRAKDEQDLGIRPYVISVKIDQVLSWRTGIVGGERILMQFVFREVTDEADGAFGSKSVTRYRVYRQRFASITDGNGVVVKDKGVELTDPTRPFVDWELWEESGSANETQLNRIDFGTLSGPKRIPLAVVYGGKREGILRSKPPLEGLAHSNIRWAQVMSDRAYTLHKCGIPVPVIIGKLVGGADGKSESEIVMSPSRGLQLEAGGDAKMLEASGASLEQTRLELQDWEKRIGSQAIAMLQRDTAAAESATAHRLNRGREESKLSRALRSLEDALELTLQHMAAFRGLDPESIDVSIRRDFGDIVPPEVLQLLSSLEEKGQLTLTRLLAELQRAGVFSNDFDPEEEAEELEREKGQEGMGLDDPETLTDEELAVRAAELQRIAGERKTRKPPAPAAA